MPTIPAATRPAHAHRHRGVRSSTHQPMGRIGTRRPAAIFGFSNRPPTRRPSPIASTTTAAASTAAPTTRIPSACLRLSSLSPAAYPEKQTGRDPNRQGLLRCQRRRIHPDRRDDSPGHTRSEQPFGPIGLAPEARGGEHPHHHQSPTDHHSGKRIEPATQERGEHHRRRCSRNHEVSGPHRVRPFLPSRSAQQVTARKLSPENRTQRRSTTRTAQRKRRREPTRAAPCAQPVRPNAAGASAADRARTTHDPGDSDFHC